MSSLLKNSAAIQLFHFLLPKPPLFLSLSLLRQCRCLLRALDHSFLVLQLPASFVLLPSQCHVSALSRMGPPLTIVKRGTGARGAAVSPGPPPFPRPAADATLPMQQRAPVSSQKPIAWYPTATAPAGASNTPQRQELGAFNQALGLLATTPASTVPKAAFR